MLPMKTQIPHSPLQRHPKCSALYASRLSDGQDISSPACSFSRRAAYLFNVTIDVTTNTLTRDAATFALTVHDKKSRSTWRHLRSYTDCRQFQSRVLKKLNQGHFCFAECPWLFVFVQRSLSVEQTSSHLLRIGSLNNKSRFVENQRLALKRLLATLQRVLLNPLNQKCTVLMQQVLPEVIGFITNCSSEGELDSPKSNWLFEKPLSESIAFTIEETSESDKDPFGQSSTSTTACIDDLDDEFLAHEDTSVAVVDEVVDGLHVCCAMCSLHTIYSDEKVFARWRADSKSSRFVRLGAIASTGCTPFKPNRQLSMQSSTTRVISSREVRVTSPQNSLKRFYDRDSKDIVLVHDGTPSSPYPESPGTPKEYVASSYRASPAHQIDLEMLDPEQSLSPKRISEPSTVPVMPGLKNMLRLPHRSFVVLSSLRYKLTQRKHGAI
ncbi:hypothetical protein CCR75_006725 [Bremia lactucae]|uniref:PX domain-containing protein n=1 Tax=Bremia lactucae TaxID=4779 RepID=A0A976IKQ7_BRELC|nr:hypothetical protein CCR75_006725 [Bremia lactucae]